MEYYQRQEELAPLIKDMLADDRMPRHPRAYEIWSMVQAGQMTIPIDAPAWLMDDLRYISLIAEYEALPYQMKRNKKRIQDMNGRR